MLEKPDYRSSYYLNDHAGTEAFVSSEKQLLPQTIAGLVDLTLFLLPFEAVGEVKDILVADTQSGR